MGIFDFFRAAPQETKESRTGAVLVMNPGQPVWTPRDYDSFALEAYQRNVVGFSAISRIAEAVASVKWTTWRGDTEVAENDFLKLMNRPNPMQSGQEFMQAKVSYLLIAGNGYDEKVDVGSTPQELYALRPDRMTVTPADNGMPQSYCYKVGGRKVVYEVDPNTGASDILHSRMFNPLNDWYGQSAVESGAYAVDTHNEGMNWLKSLLQNSARPSGSLVVDKDSGELSEEAFNRLKAQIEEQYSGAKNAGRPMLLEGGMSWEAMGLSPSDMQIIEAKNSAARDICLAFGVPPMLLGIPGDNTYANYKEARLAFWEDTVIPLVTRIAQDYTNWLGPLFGGLELRPDLDQVPAIVDKRQTLWEMADSTDSLTLNEKRELMGYPPVTGGDTILVPTNVLPLDVDMQAAIKLAGYDAETK
jgi:HK97 family phage portal protein